MARRTNFLIPRLFSSSSSYFLIRGGGFLATAASQTVRLTDTAKKTASRIDIDPEKVAKQAWQQAEKAGTSYQKDAENAAARKREAKKETDKKKAKEVNNALQAKAKAAAAQQKAKQKADKQKAKQKTVVFEQKAATTRQKSNQKAPSYERSATSFQSMVEKRAGPAKTYPVVPKKKPQAKKARSVSRRNNTIERSPFREWLVSNSLQFVLVTSTLTAVSSILAVFIEQMDNKVFGQSAFTLDMIVTKQRILTGE